MQDAYTGRAPSDSDARPDGTNRATHPSQPSQAGSERAMDDASDRAREARRRAARSDQISTRRQDREFSSVGRRRRIINER